MPHEPRFLGGIIVIDDVLPMFAANLLVIPNVIECQPESEKEDRIYQRGNELNDNGTGTVNG